MNSGAANISLDTKISALIKADSRAIDVLCELNPHFNKLRNPVLRKLFAGRVSIAEACKISGTKPEDFMMKMKGIGFVISTSVSKNTPSLKNTAIYDHLDAVELDVRPVLAGGQDPLKIILDAISNLTHGQSLKLLNTFEPLPLINHLSKKGFSHYTEFPETNLVITWFVKSGDFVSQNNRAVENTSQDFNSALGRFSPEKLDTLDVRQLPMPQPMISILNHLENLPKEKGLLVLHKKVPVYLLPELKEKGFIYHIRETADQTVNLLIYRI